MTKKQIEFVVRDVFGFGLKFGKDGRTNMALVFDEDGDLIARFPYQLHDEAEELGNSILYSLKQKFYKKGFLKGEEESARKLRVLLKLENDTPTWDLGIPFDMHTT